MIILCFTVFGDSSGAFWTMMGFIALVVSFSMIIRQIKLQNNSNMMNFINSSEDKQRSTEYIQIRKDVCLDSTIKIGVNEECLLSFFEDLGILYKRRVIDLELIWEKFSYYIENYWILLEPNIKEIQKVKSDTTWFENFESLQKAIFKYSKQRTNNKDYHISEEDLLKFKESEKKQLVPNNSHN